MSRRLVRLIARQFAFELIAISAVLLLITLAMVAVVVLLPDLRQQLATCVDQMACIRLQDNVGLLQNLGSVAPTVASVIGPFGGMILGVSVVGREVERGTAGLAWTLSRSRRRWLIGRVIAVAMCLVVATLIPALTANLLVPVENPGVSAGTSFAGFPTRGLVPVGQALAAFCVGVLCGAVMGRALAALILALVVAFGGSLGVDAAMRPWRLNDATVLAVQSGFGGGPDDQGLYRDNLILGDELRDAYGNLLSFEEAYSRLPGGDAPDGWPNSEYDVVLVGFAGARYPEIDAREAAAWSLIAVLLVGGSALVVDRRRPY